MSTGILEFLTVFVLAAFVGIEVINAGAEHPAHAADVGQQRHPRDRAGGDHPDHGRVPTGRSQITLAFFAVLLATLNIVGGFVVTDRMLEMFKTKPAERAPECRTAD